MNKGALRGLSTRATGTSRRHLVQGGAAPPLDLGVDGDTAVVVSGGSSGTSNLQGALYEKRLGEWVQIGADRSVLGTKGNEGAVADVIDLPYTGAWAGKSWLAPQPGSDTAFWKPTVTGTGTVSGQTLTGGTGTARVEAQYKVGIHHARLTVRATTIGSGGMMCGLGLSYGGAYPQIYVSSAGVITMTDPYGVAYKTFASTAVNECYIEFSLMPGCVVVLYGNNSGGAIEQYMYAGNYAKFGAQQTFATMVEVQANANSVFTVEAFGVSP